MDAAEVEELPTDVTTHHLARRDVRLVSDRLDGAHGDVGVVTVV